MLRLGIHALPERRRDVSNVFSSGLYQRWTTRTDLAQDCFERVRSFAGRRLADGQPAPTVPDVVFGAAT